VIEPDATERVYKDFKNFRVQSPYQNYHLTELVHRFWHVPKMEGRLPIICATCQ